MAFLVAAVGVAACGGDSESTADTTTTETTTSEPDVETVAARELFVANCGSCHTLSDAGTAGAVGPRLDDGDYGRADVEDQIRNGGGGMPAFAGELTDEQIAQLADYVSR